MSSVNLPAGRNLAQEYSNTVNAQTAVAPSVFASEANLQPLYGQLSLQNINEMLNGSGEKSYNTQEYVPAVYKQGGAYSYGEIPKGLSGTINYPTLPDGSGGGTTTAGSGFKIPGIGGVGEIANQASDALAPIDPIGSGILGLFGSDKPAPLPRRLITPGGYKTIAHKIAPARGLLDLYTNDIAPTLAAGEISNVKRFGPAAMDAIKSSDPQTAALIEQMTTQSGNELGMGANLDPSLTRTATQAVRSRGQGMLGGTGNAGDFSEALGVSDFANQLRLQRRQFAGGAIGLRQSFYGDPFQRILGRASGAGPGAVAQASGAAGAAGMPGINPESGYAQDLYNTNFNSLVGKALSDAKGKNDLLGAGISAVGSLAGGGMAAI